MADRRKIGLPLECPVPVQHTGDHDYPPDALLSALAAIAERNDASLRAAQGCIVDDECWSTGDGDGDALAILVEGYGCLLWTEDHHEE